MSGLGAFIFVHSSAKVEHQPYFALLGSLGEAIFIAGFLGLTVDFILKAQLVKDIAAEALRYSWGVAAPQEYIKKLSDSIAEYDRITLTQSIRVELDWHDVDQSVVRMRYTTRSVMQNISDGKLDVVIPAVPASVIGTPDSEIESLELAVRPQPIELRAPVEMRRSWDVVQLRALYKRADGKMTPKREFASSVSDMKVPRGGTWESRCTCVRYMRAEDSSTFGNVGPVLAWTLEETGPFEELDVRTFMGLKKIELVGSNRARSGTYGFTHAGVMVEVAWDKRPPADNENEQENVRNSG
ncbi:hypothetical protein [Streptomyces lydicus]|uniref:hypothetical protein n=1 Tax=Streptomyces lydicus TaxID=47763 RepID=UPI001013B996|nr:hypothetical protein [Streptomyces lydicus]MDC7337460.1 hypothetical protein [Streptomyces lydicus]UEG93154.1 hypothetical protein LJ741_22930 [Streptomyces lydicus]